MSCMRETKRVGGHVTETKIRKVNGVDVGEVAGYIAAWTVDRGFIPDRFHPGAFLASIEEHRARGNRQVRFKDHHGRTIGGFPIDSVFEDSVGLFGRALINLEVQQGREAFALARQGVLTDFSVGFIAQEKDMIDGVRHIRRAELLEGSIVDEPMNMDARIVEVKRMTPEYPIASGDYAWDANAAHERVQAAPYGELKSGSPTIGDFLIVDRVDGKIMIVPQAVQAVARELKGQDAPDAGQVREVERLLARMNLPSPFDEARRQFFGVEDVKGWTPRDVERALVKSGAFSNGAAKVVIKMLSSAKEKDESEGLAALLEDLRSAKKAMER